MQQCIEKTHPQWHSILETALSRMDRTYLEQLGNSFDWLPGAECLLAAFSQPLDRLRFILLGESPYPRAQSANGYAFWDNSVSMLWSAGGLSREVNRATSLRNFIKMLLVARGDLQEDTSQPAIARLDKTPYWERADELFQSMLDKGFLLLNASLVYRPDQVRFDARAWRPFIAEVLSGLKLQRPNLQLLLFGRIAADVPEASFFNCLTAEHPYNLSFIRNPEILTFFQPLNILSRHE